MSDPLLPKPMLERMWEATKLEEIPAMQVLVVLPEVGQA